jgi:phosphotransferase system HPr-like phosphotransfer protein
MVENSSCGEVFKNKVRIYSHDFLKACVYISGFDSPENIFTKKLFSRLISTSHLLEDFLDLHGAKNNKQWFFYRELASTVCHLSLSGYSQRHISNRMVFYDLPDVGNFEAEGEKTLEFITESLMNIAPVVIQEASRLDIEVPKGSYDQVNFPGVLTGEMLEYDIDDDQVSEQKQYIVKIASDFLNIVKMFEPLSFYEPYTLSEITSIVPSKVSEVVIRGFEMLIHNLQSSFDSYVVIGGYRYGNRKLKQLRAHFSVVLHILEVQGKMLHYYERHLLELGNIPIYRQVRKSLSELVDPNKLLDRTINYGLFYVSHFLNAGKKVAHEILDENIEKTSIRVGIPMTRGFHNRPSMMVAKIVQHFGGKVDLIVNGDRFDASSVLDIQWAGGKIQKENITEVVFEGDVRALNDIKILASVNYAEDSMGKGLALPKELAYLK